MVLKDFAHTLVIGVDDEDQFCYFGVRFDCKYIGIQSSSED